MPKKVDDLFKEVKEGNPSYSDEQAWATAWSIYCKNVDPGSDHCKKPASEYLKEAMLVVRIAQRYRAAVEAEVSRPTPLAGEQQAAEQQFSMALEDAPDEDVWNHWEKRGEYNLNIYHPGGRRNLSFFMKNPHGGGFGSNDGTSVKGLADAQVRRVGMDAAKHGKDKVWVSVLQFDGNDWKPLKHWWQAIPPEELARVPQKPTPQEHWDMATR